MNYLSEGCSLLFGEMWDYTFSLPAEHWNWICHSEGADFPLNINQKNRFPLQPFREFPFSQREGVAWAGGGLEMKSNWIEYFRTTALVLWTSRAKLVFLCHQRKLPPTQAPFNIWCNGEMKIFMIFAKLNQWICSKMNTRIESNFPPFLHYLPSAVVGGVGPIANTTEA